MCLARLTVIRANCRPKFKKKREGKGGGGSQSLCSQEVILHSALPSELPVTHGRMMSILLVITINIINVIINIIDFIKIIINILLMSIINVFINIIPIMIVTVSFKFSHRKRYSYLYFVAFFWIISSTGAHNYLRISPQALRLKNSLLLIKTAANS